MYFLTLPMTGFR